MQDPIQNYRGPIATVIGIFLGFLLNAVGTWVSQTGVRSPFKEVVTAIGLFCCIVSLLIVLYRMLNIEYPHEHAVPYFKKTLHLLFIGLTIAFLSFFLIKLESFI